MLNPQEYAGQYEHFGKFEGESNATVYYYECIMNGDGEHIANPYDLPLTLFTMTDQEAKAFGNDAGVESGDTVLIIENDIGFVSMCAFATRVGAEWWIKKEKYLI